MALLDQYGRPMEAAPKMVRARYDAAQRGSENDQNHWQYADSLSAVSANSHGVRRTLRDRSRYEVANNSYARGIIDTLTAYTCGSGPRLQLTYRGEPSQETAKACRKVERLFGDWAYTRKLASKVQTLHKAMEVDGEGFARITTGKASMRTPVSLDFNVVECDRFDSWSWTGVHEDEAGVKIDANGDPEAYAYLKYHPGSMSQYHVGLNQSDWVSADTVMHLFRADRPEQLRGIPRTTPALPLFALLRRYCLATVSAAETAANFAAILASDQVIEGQTQAEVGDSIPILRNMMATLPGGTRLQQLKAEHPITTFDEFVRALIREICRCLQIPLGLALGTHEHSNYSSSRQDFQAFYKSIDVDRALILELLGLDRLYELWLDEAVLIDGFLPPEFTAEIWEFDWRWVWMGSTQHVDRSKEAQGQQMQLTSHTTTYAREYAQQGLDWETELRQKAVELRLMTELGLQPVVQTTGGAQPTNEPPEETPEEDATEDPADEMPEEEMSDA